MIKATKYTTHQPIINQIERPGAERNVLAIILNDSNKIYDVGTHLREEDFNSSVNQFLYRVMLRLAEKGIEITVPNILAVSNKNDLLGQHGEEYLRRIAMSNVANINLDYNIQLVKVASLKRKAYKEALNVIHDCTNDNIVDDANTLIGRQQQRFMDLSFQTGDRVLQIGDGIEEWLQDIIDNPTPIPGLRSGFPELDKAIGGFRPGRAYLFTARSKARKSLLLNNFAAHISVQEGYPILYLDTEMDTAEDVRPRIWAIISGVDEDDITTGMYLSDPFKKNRVEIAKEVLKNTPFYHAYIPNYNASQVVSLVRKHHIKNGIKAVFFDYIKMPQQYDSGLKEYQLLGQILGKLKDLAGELKIPLITAAQMNRSGIGLGGKNDEPDSGMIGASDRLLHNTSYLFYLWHKSPERIMEDGGPDAGNMCLMLGESRHGGNYYAWLDAHPKNARIIEVQKIS